ncbi:MAG: hypothetical protein ACR2MN_07285 [Acidimicrobiales bacterium]
MTTTSPAGQFAALLHARLAASPPVSVIDAPAMQPAPRVPAPNPAQGGSGRAGPPAPPPADVLGRLFATLGAPVGDGGWRQVR